MKVTGFFWSGCISIPVNEIGNTFPNFQADPGCKKINRSGKDVSS
jgi:hypothetical protein